MAIDYQNIDAYVNYVNVTLKLCSVRSHFVSLIPQLRVWEPFAFSKADLSFSLTVMK